MAVTGDESVDALKADKSTQEKEIYCLFERRIHQFLIKHNTAINKLSESDLRLLKYYIVEQKERLESSFEICFQKGTLENVGVESIINYLTTRKLAPLIKI